MTSYTLRFQHLHDQGRAYCFPCDEKGVVELNKLSERARANYFFAHRSVGRDVAVPTIEVLQEVMS